MDVPWDDLLFEDGLDRVGQRLQDAERAGQVGAVAHLEAGHEFALAPGHVGAGDQQTHHDHHGLDDRDPEIAYPIHIDAPGLKMLPPALIWQSAPEAMSRDPRKAHSAVRR